MLDPHDDGPDENEGVVVPRTFVVARGNGATVNRCVNSSGGFLPVLLVALSDAVDVSDPVGDLRE